jgi:hypothetical protein
MIGRSRGLSIVPAAMDWQPPEGFYVLFVTRHVSRLCPSALDVVEDVREPCIDIFQRLEAENSRFELVGRDRLRIGRSRADG